jgi:hypothetical protein
MAGTGMSYQEVLDAASVANAMHSARQAGVTEEPR